MHRQQQEIIPMANVKTVTISGQPMDVPSKYAEGHVLTAREAEALNGYRAELIGHGFRKPIKDAVDAGNFDKDATQAEINEAAAKYEFGAGGGGRRLDPVEKEAKIIAEDTLAEILRSKGLTPSVYKKDNKAKYDAALETISAKPEVIAKAKKLVEARTVKGMDLSGLDLDTAA